MDPDEETSFAELDAQMAEMEEAGVPDEWSKSFRKIRAELANKRQKYGPLEEAFAGLHEGDKAAFVTLAAALKDDPARAAQMFVEASRAVAEATGNDWNELAGIPAVETPAEEAAELPAEEETPVEDQDIETLVQSKIDAILAEREKAAEIKRMEQSITDKLKALGYDDPSDPSAQLVLLRAKQNESAADVLDAIQQAHDGMAEFILERSKTLAPADAGVASSSDDGSLADEIPSPSEDARTPRSMKDMEQAMKDRLASAFEQPAAEDAGV